jgi:DNA-3-methyladenine glycosylase II
MGTARSLHVEPPFSLATTCGPVSWGRGRWPNTDWRDGELIWVGWEEAQVVYRLVRQCPDDGPTLTIRGTASPDRDRRWANDVLGTGAELPAPIDPVVDAIRARFPGLRAWANGSLYEGLIGAIVGQSISVAAASVTEARLSALFPDGIEIAGRHFWPLPRVDLLANAEPAYVRPSGVTWRRADALVRGAQAFLDGQLPTDDEARADHDRARTALRTLPLVGPWTAESVLLWGLGLGNAYPPRDVALLRATRLAYDRPDLDHPGLNALADTWSPHRAWAARWLWTALLGAAPLVVQGDAGSTSTAD